jgi:lon-related putative ATP-dependent protease
MTKRFTEVPAELLRARVDPDSLPFESTQSLETPEGSVLGQVRASDAIRFGVGLKASGYHIYVAGPPKTGLTHIARSHLEEQAAKEPTPPDWCYVFNFKEPDKPKSLKVTAGRAREFKKDMHAFITALQTRIPEVFESEDYAVREKDLQREFERNRRLIIETLSAKVREKGFILQVSQVGMVVIPATAEGQPMGQEELSDKSDDDKRTLREKSEELQASMKEAIKKIREAEQRLKEQRAELDRVIALSVVDGLMDFHFDKYKEEPAVQEYLKLVQEDIVENIDDFKKKEESAQQVVPQFPIAVKKEAFKKYDINVLVDNSETRGAPVVIESNPIYPNLFGTIERQAWFGALFTDFTMIKPGVLHKANGGYLLMKALDLLKWYLSYEALKRALRDREIRIEDIAELYGLFSTRTIRPEPIPLDIKIVLTGDPYLFELLHFYDDHFQKLFKVKAHLDDRMDRKEDTILQCARMMGQFCRTEKIRHLHRSGVARILEYGMERTEDHDKLTLELGDLSDLIREADYFAGLSGADLIRAEHVEEAVQKRIFRSNLIEERIKELVQKDVFWIETDGYRTGQINGLSIFMTGDYEFGKPNRITATVSVGRDGVIAVERESKLSGSIHTKGVMILTSFLKERFGHNKPMALTATLCFEQSYGLVEGDSASSTELYSLLSALARVPIYQGIAVTGSVSQKGEIQAVGGVTRKVEAFYDICKYKGLNGRQGVIIPAKNLKNLMLRQDVIDRVREGQFHIWPISTVEEGIEILTGMPAGVPGEDGSYPEGTLFRKVDDRMVELAEIARKFGREGEEGKAREAEGGPCS